MSSRHHTFVAAGMAMIALAGMAKADSIEFHLHDGVNVLLHSSNYEAMTGQSGAFNNPPSVNQIISSMASDGISIQNAITMVAVDTTEGLALYAIFDHTLGAVLTPWGGSSTVNLGPAPGAGGGLISAVQPPNPNEVDTTIDFEVGKSGNYLVWNGATHGDVGALTIADLQGLGLAEYEGVQFVSWGGDGWGQVASGNAFGPSGTFSFDFAVMPVPTALGIGLVGLGGVIVCRRRRTA